MTRETTLVPQTHMLALRSTDQTVVAQLAQRVKLCKMSGWEMWGAVQEIKFVGVRYLHVLTVDIRVVLRIQEVAVACRDMHVKGLVVLLCRLRWS